MLKRFRLNVYLDEGIQAEKELSAYISSIMKADRHLRAESLRRVLLAGLFSIRQGNFSVKTEEPEFTREQQSQKEISINKKPKEKSEDQPTKELKKDLPEKVSSIPESGKKEENPVQSISDSDFRILPANLFTQDKSLGSDRYENLF